MTLQELIDRAIFVAYGTTVPSGEDAIIQADLQAEALAPHAFVQVTREIMSDPHKAHLLMKNVDIDLANGVGDIPAGFLSEFIDMCSVRDDDPTANNGYGNVLTRIHQFNDFLEWHFDPRFGYYCLNDSKIYMRSIGTGAIDGNGNIQLDGAFELNPADIASLPDEALADVIIVLARLLREGVKILSDYKTLTYADIY